MITMILWGMIGILLRVSATDTEVGLIWDGFDHPATNTVAERFGEIEIAFEFGMPRIRSAISVLKAIVTNYKVFPIWVTDSDLSKKFKTQLDVALPQIEEIHALYLTLEEALLKTSSEISMPALGCKLKRAITDQPVVDRSVMLHAHWERLVLLAPTVEKFKDGLITIQFVEFVENFVGELSALHREVALNMTLVHNLLEEIMPLDFIAQNCLFEFAKQENAVSIECGRKNRKLNCLARVVAEAKNEHDIISLIPISYGGCQIYMPEGGKTFWGRSASRGTIFEYNCPWDDNNNKLGHLCSESELADPCSRGLSAKDIPTILKECRFVYREPIPAQRTRDGGILILGQKAQVYEGGQLILRNTPYILYTNVQVVVKIEGGTEIDFPPDVKFPTQHVVGSSLSVWERTQILTKCAWDTWFYSFTENFSYPDMLGAGALVLSLFTTPLTMLLGACALCRMRKLRKHLSKHGRPLTRSERKRRHKENSAFLERHHL